MGLILQTPCIARNTRLNNSLGK